MTPNFKAIVAKVGCPCHVWGAIEVVDDAGKVHQRFVNVRDLSGYAAYKEFTLLVSSHQHPWITTRCKITREEMFTKQ